MDPRHYWYHCQRRGINSRAQRLEAGGDARAQLESIYWGEIIPGRNSTAVIYIKNRCKTPLTLNCTLANFSPVDAADYLNLDWDREAYVLEAHKTVEARLLLSVSGSAVFDVFNVETLISGTA